MSNSGFSYGLLAAATLVALVAGGLRAPEREVPPAPVPPAASPMAMPLPALGSGLGGVALPRAADGHFYADAQVNGTSVRFLVDTGASAVVLTRADARRVGIGEGDFTAEGIGAGGRVRLRPVVLARVALGTVSADNVPAMVAEKGLPVSLMGQSFLGRWDEVRIAGDRLTMR